MENQNINPTDLEEWLTYTAKPSIDLDDPKIIAEQNEENVRAESDLLLFIATVLCEENIKPTQTMILTCLQLVRRKLRSGHYVVGRKSVYTAASSLRLS